MIFKSKQLTSVSPPDEGPFRTQGSKPPPPPGPTYRTRLAKWLRWVFTTPNSIDPWHVRVGWGIAFVGAATLGAIVGFVALAIGIQRHFSPCATDDEVKATKSATAPDGTPVMVPTSWCVKYKPGREGETP